MLKIGLSLSFCIQDICKGLVEETEVACIVANSCAANEKQWAVLIERYQATYWRNFPEQARMFVSILRESNRIIQPRLLGQPMHHLTTGHWIDLPASI